MDKRKGPLGVFSPYLSYSSSRFSEMTALTSLTALELVIAHVRTSYLAIAIACLSYVQAGFKQTQVYQVGKLLMLRLRKPSDLNDAGGLSGTYSKAQAIESAIIGCSNLFRFIERTLVPQKL